MNRLLRRSRSASFDGPTSDPFAAIPVAIAAPAAPAAATAAPTAAIPPPAAVSAARLPPDIVQGKQAVPAGVASSSSLATHGAPATTLLQTTGSVPVQPLHLGGSSGGLVPRVPAPAIGSSSSDGLPLSISHHFTMGRLEHDSGNYTKWRQLFYFVSCKYNVQHHLDVPSAPLRKSAIWRNDDLTMVLWFYGVITDDLMDVVGSPDSTAFDIWTQLHLHFRDNQAGRAVILGAEFRNLVQGDLSVAEYCRRLKSLTIELGEVGERVTDQTLTLQLIRGLSRKYHVMATLLPMQSPFPSFVQARSRLLMEEITANERARLDAAPSTPPPPSPSPTMALTTAAPSASPTPPPTRAGTPPPPPTPTKAAVAADVAAALLPAASHRAGLPRLGAARHSLHPGRTHGTSPRTTPSSRHPPRGAGSGSPPTPPGCSVPGLLLRSRRTR
ncbi:hypothetical protein VPH35_019431 [Triticum aestivum]|uniref:uncharacterized protein n=1 Tax=Triticum aestivum TaxID=4565 RepID=UPI001D02C6EA|nr:uncharacterized protein LOC123184828 [Triticum aestivum]